jgi:hypothetical protein
MARDSVEGLVALGKVERSCVPQRGRSAPAPGPLGMG